MWRNWCNFMKNVNGLGVTSNGWAKKWLLEMKYTLGEDAVKIVEVTTKGTEEYINLLDKPVAGFDRIDFSFERSSTVIKILSNCTTCHREIFHEKNSHWCCKPLCCLILRNWKIATSI